jgi:hypothetical protein
MASAILKRPKLPPAKVVPAGTRPDKVRAGALPAEWHRCRDFPATHPRIVHFLGEPWEGMSVLVRYLAPALAAAGSQRCPPIPPTGGERSRHCSPRGAPVFRPRPVAVPLPSSLGRSLLRTACLPPSAEENHMSSFSTLRLERQGSFIWSRLGIAERRPGFGSFARCSWRLPCRAYPSPRPS